MAAIFRKLGVSNRTEAAGIYFLTFRGGSEA
jgi:DNA-binding NarL/FixJ family response regulator